MLYFVFALPVLSALLGWAMSEIILRGLVIAHKARIIAGIKFQGLLPRYRQNIIQEFVTFISEQMAHSSELEDKILSPDNLQRIMPEVEAHIDHFLKVKLKVSMPMIGMLIGERTTSQLKEIFIRELEELFPIILKSYIASVKNGFDLQQFLEERLDSLPTGSLEQLLEKVLAPWTKKIKFAGVFLGFLIGCVNLLLTVLLYHRA